MEPEASTARAAVVAVAAQMAARLGAQVGPITLMPPERGGLRVPEMVKTEEPDTLTHSAREMAAAAGPGLQPPPVVLVAREESRAREEGPGLQRTEGPEGLALWAAVPNVGYGRSDNRRYSVSMSAITPGDCVILTAPQP